MLQSIFEYPFLFTIFNNDFKLLIDQDKIAIISISKSKFIFHERHFISSENSNKRYFNRLTNIRVREMFEFPSLINTLNISCVSRNPKPFTTKIPEIVKHQSNNRRYITRIYNFVSCL